MKKLLKPLLFSVLFTLIGATAFIAPTLHAAAKLPARPAKITTKSNNLACAMCVLIPGIGSIMCFMPGGPCCTYARGKQAPVSIALP